MTFCEVTFTIQQPLRFLKGLPVEQQEEFRRIDPALVSRQTFRHVDARQLDAIRGRLASANLGGLLLQVDPLPQLDMIAEVLFRVAPQTPLLSGVGVVVRVDRMNQNASVRLLRMLVCDDQGDAAPVPAEKEAAGETPGDGSPPLPASTRILQEGSTLTVVGEFNVKTTDAFNTSWEKVLESKGPHITIDLTHVQRISSMAIGLLVSAQMDAMQVQRSLTVRVPVSLERIFRVSRVDKVLRFVYVSPNGEEEDELPDDVDAPPSPPDTQTYLRQIEERQRDQRSS